VVVLAFNLMLWVGKKLPLLTTGILFRTIASKFNKFNNIQVWSESNSNEISLFSEDRMAKEVFVQQEFLSWMVEGKVGLTALCTAYYIRFPYITDN
jgi:hypothetical protein